MELFTPFSFSYPTWIGVFVLTPLAILWIFNFTYFKSHFKIFLLAIVGSIIFSFPWDLIAIKEEIWLFEKPYIVGVWFLGLPIEEWMFIVLVTGLFTSVTLLLWKRFGNSGWYV